MTTTFQEAEIKNENFSENDKGAVALSILSVGLILKVALWGRLPSRKIMNLFLSGRKNAQNVFWGLGSMEISQSRSWAQCHYGYHRDKFSLGNSLMS